eukprot:scaffold13509_cov157-Amphora_coffeaeformis.AAC.8
MLNIPSFVSTVLWTSLATRSTELIQVTGLYRYAVKGLSGDALSTVSLGEVGETFPDDRRYALLYDKNLDKFNGKDWLHKENFLCAFTDPALMASLQSSYQIDVSHEDGTTIVERMLQIKDRSTGHIVFKSTDLATKEGRRQLGIFLSEKSGKTVVCVTADDFCDDTAQNGDDDKPHRFQFGNTSSGYKQNKGDTRTIHIVNQKTVDAVSEAIGIPLDPRRFRPNMVIDGPPPFSEFEWVETNQSLLTPDGQGRFRALSRTVRCRGISLDPFDAEHGQVELDLPGLLAKHFPQHGPYLGIYACLDRAPCSVSVGDELKLSSDTAESVE